MSIRSESLNAGTLVLLTCGLRVAVRNWVSLRRHLLGSNSIELLRFAENTHGRQQLKCEIEDRLFFHLLTAMHLVIHEAR